MFIGCLDSQLSQNYCRVFASSAAFGAAFAFFEQLCELWKAWCRASACCGSARLGHFARNCPSLAFQKSTDTGLDFSVLAPEKSQTKITNDILIVSQQCELTSAYDSGDSSMAMNMKN